MINGLHLHHLKHSRIPFSFHECSGSLCLDRKFVLLKKYVITIVTGRKLLIKNKPLKSKLSFSINKQSELVKKNLNPVKRASIHRISM